MSIGTAVLLTACGTDPTVVPRVTDGGGSDVGHRDAAGLDATESDSSSTDVIGADVPTAGDASTIDTTSPDAGPSGCEAGGPGCTCITEPRPGLQNCRHSFGGLYGPNACSGSFQCCDGRFRSGAGSCGTCACTDATGRVGCHADSDGARVCFDEFDGRAEPLPAGVRARMMDVSYRAGCPVGLDALSYLTFPHWGFDGGVHRGEMVVATTVATNALSVFEDLYRLRFPLERVELVDNYGADDDASMAVNNSSAFNCRRITGGSSYSQHSFGTAIDLNPRQNPYVSGSTVLPPEGRDYLNRGDVRTGMFTDPDPVTGAFRRIGWTWGGTWASLKDYQHFSLSGR